MSRTPHIMIAEARFYSDIADMLLSAVKGTLEARSISYEVFTVPGALEIPAAIKIGAMRKRAQGFDAFIALGCVIRGETTHYDLVAGESARAIMDLSIYEDLVIANGILTCENRDQAIARADANQKNKGKSFAETALDMFALKQEIGLV